MRHLFIPLWARFTVIGALVGSLMLALAIGVLAQTETPTPSPTAPAASKLPTRTLPPELAFLRGMSPAQRFDHLSGAQVTFVNPQGQPVVVNLIPGTVTAVTSTSLTIQPNGATQMRRFNVAPTTYVRGSPHTGSVEAFAGGDRVVVVQIGNSGDATAIYGHDFDRGGGMMMLGHAGILQQGRKGPLGE